MPTYADLRDKNIVVTGGANGIGAAIVRAFHAQDARLFFCDTDAEAGEALARELGDRASFARVDLTREPQIVRWVKQITRDGNAIHALVNNAARDPRMTLESMSARQWDDLFASNLRAYFLMARETAPSLAKSKGAMINFSSVTFHTAPTPMSAYVATKGGILGFTPVARPRARSARHPGERGFPRLGHDGAAGQAIHHARREAAHPPFAMRPGFTPARGNRRRGPVSRQRGQPRHHRPGNPRRPRLGAFLITR